MQKLLLTLSLTVFVVVFSMAANLNNESSNSLNESQQTNTSLMTGNAIAQLLQAGQPKGKIVLEIQLQ